MGLDYLVFLKRKGGEMKEREQDYRNLITVLGIVGVIVLGLALGLHSFLIIIAVMGWIVYRVGMASAR